MTNAFIPEVLQDLTPESRAARLFEYYYCSRNDDGSPRFSGSRFDSLGKHASDDSAANEITAEDIAAVLCLGVNIPGDAVVKLLECNKSQISELLGQIPVNVSLWDSDQAEVEAKSSASNKLWNELKSIHGIKAVKVSKLMARKRPRLIPIYDRRIQAALKLSSATGYWTIYRNLMLASVNGKPLYEGLQELVAASKVGPNVTALRACDVILWSHESDFNLPS